METLSALMTTPLDAVTGLMETVLPGTPTAATAAGSVPNPTFTEDTLRMILHNILTGDSRLQGQMLSKYWAPDASYSLNEGLLQLEDRDSLVSLLRGVQLTTTVEPEVLEITSTTDKAVILLNLHLSYKAVPLTWFKATRIQVPATFTITFGPDPSAVISAASDYVITDFKQEMSLPDLLWWNPAWNWVNARLWGPVSGKVLAKFVQLEEPFVNRFQQYMAGGAGYVQALVWVAQDAARAMASSRHPPPPSPSLLEAAVAPATPGPASPVSTVPREVREVSSGQQLVGAA